MQINGIELEEYFRYHPPQTEERQKKHDVVNAAMLKYCQNLLACLGEELLDDIDLFCDEAITVAQSVCEDWTCLHYARRAISEAHYSCKVKRPEAVLMHVQQARMFLNQGITIAELREKHHDTK